jgi:hypothetical protein
MPGAVIRDGWPRFGMDVSRAGSAGRSDGVMGGGWPGRAGWYDRRPGRRNPSRPRHCARGAKRSGGADWPFHAAPPGDGPRAVYTRYSRHSMPKDPSKDQIELAQAEALGFQVELGRSEFSLSCLDLRDDERSLICRSWARNNLVLVGEMRCCLWGLPSLFKACGDVWLASMARLSSCCLRHSEVLLIGWLVQVPFALRKYHNFALRDECGSTLFF